MVTIVRGYRMKLKDTITGISFDNKGNLILSGKFIVKELRGEKNEEKVC